MHPAQVGRCSRSRTCKPGRTQSCDSPWFKSEVAVQTHLEQQYTACCFSLTACCFSLWHSAAVAGEVVYNPSTHDTPMTIVGSLLQQRMKGSPGRCPEIHNRLLKPS
jgi:hypothetical protein